MRKVDLTELKQLAQVAQDDILLMAHAMDRSPKIYLHWTAGRYNTPYDDYHINIKGDGSIYVSTENLSDILHHTWRRNTGSIGVTLCCGLGAGSESLGDFPPTPTQIEVMAQVIAVLCDAMGIPITKMYVLTHGEAANNEDGLHTHEPYAWWNDGYGDGDTRGDLEYLGTAESPSYNPYATDGSRGGDVLRGKAVWYQNYWRGQNE